MILLFTSNNCTWCSVVKRKIDEEASLLDGMIHIHEVNIDQHEHIAEIYGVMVVPTLISGPNVLSGVPSGSDLHSFFLKAAAGSFRAAGTTKIPKFLFTDGDFKKESNLVERSA